TNA
ncbi:hypothetical protein SCA6_006817, partial [Theobroma cacao]